MKEIPSRHGKRHRHMQHNFEDEQYQKRICQTKTSRESPRVKPCQTALEQVSEYTARPQSQQRNGNREECEVVEEHHGEQSGKGQLQQQGGKAGEPQAREQDAFADFSGRRNRVGSLNRSGHEEMECDSLAEGRRDAAFLEELVSWLVFENDLRDGLLRGVR